MLPTVSENKSFKGEKIVEQYFVLPAMADSLT